MKPIKFKEQTNILAEDQPEYIPLPVHISEDNITVTSCWQLDQDELEDIRNTGKIWLQVHTFGGLLQPQLLRTDKPEFI